MARFSTVFVVGVAHCGSTLLGRILNGHPEVFCGGELMRLDQALRSEFPCGCGAALPDCEFWGPRLERLGRETGGSWTGFDVDTFRALGREVGARTVVDLSKSLVWRRATGLRRRTWRDGDDVGYVLLLRDSRGVLAATARVGKDLRGPIARHVKWARRLERFAARLGDRATTVRYEDLCADPERCTRALADFVGLEFDEAMLRPADHVHHFVHSSRSPYLARSNEIRLDQRWQRELADDARREIERAMARVPLLQTTYLEG